MEALCELVPPGVDVGSRMGLLVRVLGNGLSGRSCLFAVRRASALLWEHIPHTAQALLLVTFRTLNTQQNCPLVGL